MSWGESADCTIGKFQGSVRRRYVVQACSLHDAPEFQALDPHLQIKVNPVDFKKVYANSGMLELSSIFLFLLSMACFALGRFWAKARTGAFSG